jgi:hypothetical protein
MRSLFVNLLCSGVNERYLESKANSSEKDEMIGGLKDAEDEEGRLENDDVFGLAVGGVAEKLFGRRLACSL